MTEIQLTGTPLIDTSIPAQAADQLKLYLISPDDVQFVSGAGSALDGSLGFGRFHRCLPGRDRFRLELDAASQSQRADQRAQATIVTLEDVV